MSRPKQFEHFRYVGDKRNQRVHDVDACDDQSVIDGLINGSARFVGWLARVFRTLQTGFLNHYAIAMIVGLAVCLVWFIPLLTRR